MIVAATSRTTAHVLVLAQIAWLSIKLLTTRRRLEEGQRRHWAARRAFFERKRIKEADLAAREADLDRRKTALAAREARLARDQLKIGG
jgi:hypothetical protein